MLQGAAAEGAEGEAPVKVEAPVIKVKVMIELPCKGARHAVSLCSALNASSSDCGAFSVCVSSATSSFDSSACMLPHLPHLYRMLIRCCRSREEED